MSARQSSGCASGSSGAARYLKGTTSAERKEPLSKEEQDRIRDQALLRKRFRENLDRSRASEARAAKKDQVLQEFRWLVRAQQVEKECRAHEQTWRETIGDRRRHRERRRRELLDRGEQQLHLIYGKMYVPGDPAHVAVRRPPSDDESPPRYEESVLSDSEDQPAWDAFFQNYRTALGRTTPRQEHAGLRKEEGSRQGEAVGHLSHISSNKSLLADGLMEQLKEAAHNAHGRSAEAMAKESEEDLKDAEHVFDHAEDVAFEPPPEARPGALPGAEDSAQSGIPRKDATLRGFLELRSFLEAREGAALTAWLKFFDKDGDRHVSMDEFIAGMQAMGWQSDAQHNSFDCSDLQQLFELLDSDDSGFLSLEEIDKAQAVLWEQFRYWAAATFESPEDMFKRAGGKSQYIVVQQFSEAMMREGWTGGCEDLLFQSLDVMRKGRIALWNFKWLELERRRWRIKEEAREKAFKEMKRKIEQRRVAEQNVEDFKQMLKRRFGGFVRAWRLALSPDDSFTLQKHHFLKACSQLGWKGDSRTLWKYFDKDDSGVVTLDELDPQSAEVFAQFQHFIKQKFGTCVKAFHALDKDGTNTIRCDEFAEALRELGFRKPAKLLFHGLDKDGTKILTVDSMTFMDKWRPLPFLIAEIDFDAANKLKEMLIAKFGNFLKAWRHLLDKDSSNRCSWQEFHSACKKLGFSGSIAGAWRALDEDLSGYISLGEIDHEANQILVRFRKWADKEFGGVRSAFAVFDADGSNEVSRTEFLQCCRIFGFKGGVAMLFRALDVEVSNTLSMDEVAFLDDWDCPGYEQELADSVDLHSSVEHSRNDHLRTPSRTMRTGSKQSAHRQGRRSRADEGDKSPAPVQQYPPAEKQTCVSPGLQAWQSRSNPWHWPRQGGLPPMEHTVAALMRGKPPPQVRGQAKASVAKNSLNEVKKVPEPTVPLPLLSLADRH